MSNGLKDKNCLNGHVIEDTSPKFLISYTCFGFLSNKRFMHKD